MEKAYILHMITAAKNLSPFDVNMAIDAGWTNCLPYINVENDEVQALVQDAIFSRGPSGVKRTGIFFGGRDMHTAMDMMQICRESMVPPFEVSAFADPSGAFTTAAGMVAKVEKALKDVHGTDLKDKCVVALGGTGPVGMAAAVIAAKAGADVQIMGRKKDKAQRVAGICNAEYGSEITGIRGEANEHIDDILDEVDVVFATAAAGVQVMNENQVKSATRLKVAADVNAVPPTGISGLDVMDDAAPIKGSESGAVGIGALAIGNAKYQTQHRLLKQMCEEDKPVYLHFEHAFEVARDYVNGK
ncbi:MAG: NAD(P)-dependent methylenetetrahydromethanopterin dehydrogenase [Gammaproteobacteria bacterium]|nr:NAD(P)-dependent methylenetetrahydromethanopterin dehydrogenase [Gammaproteobacteria bacterium]